MKNLKSVIVGLVAAIISMSAFADWCSENNSTPYSVRDCRARIWKDQHSQFSILATSLYIDKNDLGLTKEERKAVLKYSTEVGDAAKNSCDADDHQCKLTVYTTAVKELKAFENQKKAEKAKRVGVQARPSLSATMGASATKSNPQASRAAADAEMTRKAEEAMKSVSKMKQYDSSLEGGD